jgi:hypothetical protein
MANPLRLKSSATPVTPANFQGLQTMTDTEIKNYIANVITVKFATDTNGTGTAELNVDTANLLTGTSIGTFVDTDRQEATGVHPASGAIDTVTYYAKQVTSAAAGSVTNRPLEYASGVSQLTDGEINTDILDKVINAMVTESSTTAGQYKLQATAPSGGTWVSRYTLTDVANGGNTTTYLWQKTAATSSADSSLRPLKRTSTNIQEMTDAEIQEMVPAFRNRIISTSIGTYALQTSAPGSGTWVQLGNSFSDTREQVVSQNYVGTYSGPYTGTYAGPYSATYTGTYSGPYTGTYSGPYTGTYSGGYRGTYTGSYSGPYTGTYSGPYTGTYSGPYTGTYSGPYTGTYSGGYRGTYTGTYSGPYTGTYSGPYTGFYSGGYRGTYTGFYTGFFSATYTLFYGGFVGGNFRGTYSQAFTGFYSATYTGTYSGPYTGSYAGPYTGSYAGPYSATYTGTYSGPYTGTYSGPYTGTYSGPYTGTYSGPYSATYTGTYSGPYTGTYSGPYTGTYSGGYRGTYTGTYSGPYTGTYSGTYAGDTIIATKDTVSTVALWVRTA